MIKIWSKIAHIFSNALQNKHTLLFISIIFFNNTNFIILNFFSSIFKKKNVFLNHRKNSCRGSSKIISFALTRGLTSDNTPFVRFIFDKKCLKFNDSHNSGKPISRRYGEKLFDFLTSFSQFLTSSQRSF